MGTKARSLKAERRYRVPLSQAQVTDFRARRSGLESFPCPSQLRSFSHAYPGPQLPPPYTKALDPLLSAVHPCWSLWSCFAQAPEKETTHPDNWPVLSALASIPPLRALPPRPALRIKAKPQWTCPSWESIMQLLG